MDIQFLDWDTIHFGFKIGIIEIDDKRIFSLEQLKEDAANKDYKLVYLKSPVLLDDSSLFYDEKLVYSKVNNRINAFLCSEIELYRRRDIEPEIYQLALKSGEYSRYKLDDKFPIECFKVLYNRWIENSIYTDFATDVLVYRMNDIPVGLLTYTNNKKTSNIGIIAVNPKYQGCGVGSKLIKRYQSLLDDDIMYLNVVTQGVNCVARSFYEKNGYEISSRTFIYHLWI